MDQQNILFLGFLTVTLAVSAFILWGPSPRPKKKKGHIVGLENLGSTCFLNTLLQALASCALFMQWLMQQKHEKDSLTTSLSEILWVLNGEGKTDTYAPVEVLYALKRHGWMVPSGEHDAHELFHVIVSTLQDENQKLNKSASLSDALPESDVLPLESNTNGDKLNGKCSESVQAGSSHCKTNLSSVIESIIAKDEAKLAQGDTGNPNSEEPPCGDSLFVGNEGQKLFSEQTLQLMTERLRCLAEESEKETRNNCGDVEETKPEFRNSNGDSSLKDKQMPDVGTKDCETSPEATCDKSPVYQGCYDRVAGKFLRLPQTEAPPFQGLLTSTLQCSVCGYYSSLHYDTFDSLSLPLGDNFHLQVVKLQDLLQRFVKTEIIPEVECEKCCRKTTALKTMNFGKLNLKIFHPSYISLSSSDFNIEKILIESNVKFAQGIKCGELPFPFILYVNKIILPNELPACLCLHIARTTWQSYSHAPTKRDDFVDFPEYLPMDDYTASARMKKNSDSSLDSVKSEIQVSEKRTYKHMYRLKSVVVHLGDVSSGHFLTYRRGALNSMKRHRMGNLAGAYTDSRRWFMTSDDNVKVSTLCEAMESLAYMLFYEKCSPDMFPIDDE